MSFPQIFLPIYQKGLTVKAGMKTVFFFLASDHDLLIFLSCHTNLSISNDEMGTETPKAILFL